MLTNEDMSMQVCGHKDMQDIWVRGYIDTLACKPTCA